MIPSIKIYKTNAMSVSFTKDNSKDTFTLFYSYETCVGFKVEVSPFTYSYKIDKKFSNTTNRHKSLMGISDALALESDKFYDTLNEEFNRFLC